MHSARDTEDARLLAAGDHATLLATYLPVIRRRVAVRRYPAADAEDLVSQVLERLVRELAAGRTYPVPYRVVVHRVVGWVCAAYHRPEEAPLPEGWDPGADDDALRRAEERMSLVSLFAGLPERERQLAWLVYGEGMAITDAADAVGVTRNAADQALYRARRALRRAWDG